MKWEKVYSDGTRHCRGVKKNTNFVLQSIPNKTISSVHYYNDYIRIKIFSEIKTNAHVNMG